MGSLRLALLVSLLALPFGAPADEGPRHPPGPPPLPALGSIPKDKAEIERWALQWPRWQQERRHLDEDLRELRERLRDEGEAEARRTDDTPWWNLPQRQRQMARLRYLQRLRGELERAQARLFQVQAIEAQWREDLERRQTKRPLSEPLKTVLQDLRQQAEKDNKDREESI